MTERPELLIVGGGPAGVSAALWAVSLDLQALLIDEGTAIGGTLHHLYFAPRDVTGVREVDGAGLAAIYAQQLADVAVPVRTGVRVARIEATHADSISGEARAPIRVPGAWSPAGADRAPVAVVTHAGERLEAQALLIATGTRRRRLEVPGERELEDRGVSYSANGDREQLRGRIVAVAGGGDAAYANAMILARLGCVVTLVVREKPRARPEFQAGVAAFPAITVLTHTRVRAIEGSTKVEAVALDGADGATRLPVEAIVIKAGMLPNSEWLGDAVARDAEGFVIVDARQRTSLARVWAAGDIVRPALPSIAVAAGGAALTLADMRAELKGRELS